MVEPVGLEPTLPPCKGGVLPLNYGPVKIMVGAAGIEPATACSQSRRAASALRSDAVTLPCSGLLCSTLPRRCVPHISEHCSTLLCLANLCPAKYQRPPARCRRPSGRGTSESLPEILGRDPDDHGPAATATVKTAEAQARRRGPSPGNDRWLFPKWKTPRLVVAAGQG